MLVSTGRDLTWQVRPPRSVFVNFPMGNPFGRPGDREQQRRILRDALQLVESADVGGILVDLPYDWGEEFASIWETVRELKSSQVGVPTERPAPSARPAAPTQQRTPAPRPAPRRPAEPGR